MSRLLLVTWDGAGNLVPTLGLAQRLATRGHEVRVLGHRSIQARCGDHGWTFREYRRVPEFDSAAPSDGDVSRMVRDLWANPEVVRDVLDELSREPADVVIGDCMLPGALSAGQAAGIATVALFHGAFALFRRGPLADALSASLPALVGARSDLGLAPVSRIGDVHDACALSLVANPREFEPAMPVPGNVRFVGPFLDAPPLLRSTSERIDETPAGDQPVVIVSFSTGNQGQTPVLQQVVAGLASLPVRVVVTTGPAIDPAALPAVENVEVVRFVPHARLLPGASAVVTHAGLGTVMAALAHGVPMVCIPLGRDQFFNAARVEALGAGTVLGRDAAPDAVAAAVSALLDNTDARASAGRLANAIAGYQNGARAIVELERLATRGAPAPVTAH